VAVALGWGWFVENTLKPVLVGGEVVLVLDQLVDEAIEVEFFKESLGINVFLMMWTLLIMTTRSVPNVI
jgi:hypothetical protein